MFPEDLRKAFAPSHPLSWLLVAVAAYVLLAPNVDFAAERTWHDGQRLGQMVLLGMAVVLMLGVPGAFVRVLAAWLNFSAAIRRALTGAFVLGAASSLIAPYPRWALLEWGMLLLLTLLALGVAAGRRDSGDGADRGFALVVYATALAYTVKTLVVYLAMLAVGPQYGMVFDVRELYPGFSNIRFFGQMQTMLLPFLVLPAIWWGATPAKRVMLMSIPAFWWMLAIGSGTRGTWVALAVGGITAFLFGHRPARLWLAWQIRALAFGAVLYAILILLVPGLLARPTAFLHRTEDLLSLSHRELLWTASINFGLDHPWLGVGPMHFSNTWNPIAAHPHNAMLQLAAEWGMPAALLFMLVFATAGLSWALRVRTVAAVSPETSRSISAVVLLAALTGAAAQAMVDGVIVMPVSQTLLAVLCGWAMGHYYPGPASVTAPTGRLLPGIVAVLLATGAVAYSAWLDVPRIEDRENAYWEESPGANLIPRFWAQGWILYD
ncbi:MAG: O-antigen ligase family protein [Burkholderiales bacterium]